MILEKGMLVTNDEFWYIVVKTEYGVDSKIKFHCICDHANNTYVFDLDEIKYYANFIMGDLSVFQINNPDYVMSRPIPYSVMCEVLRGEHDHRFLL